MAANNINVEVKCSDESSKLQRKDMVQRVLLHFGERLPRLRLLCFLDDEDPPFLRRMYGPANRGIFAPIHDNTPMADWPDDVSDLIFTDDGVSWGLQRVFDDLIYLYGSTCANEVGLTMTLAHELQHAIQHASQRKLWAINSLVQNLDRKIIDSLNLRWPDIPIEREARIVSKNVALHFFGEKVVAEYIDRKIGEHVTKADVVDWQFVRTLTASSTVNIEAETKRLFERLKSYQTELEGSLDEKKSGKNPDFLDIDLASYLAEFNPISDQA